MLSFILSILKTDFFKKSFWTSLSSVVYAAYAFAATKLVSVYYGPVGLTLFNHFQNLSSIFTVIPTDGLGRVNIKMLASHTVPLVQRPTYFGQNLSFLLLAYIAVLLLILLLYPFMNDSFTALFDAFSIAIVLIALFFQMVTFVVVGYFMATHHIKTYALLSISNNFLGLVLLYNVAGKVSEGYFMVWTSISVCIILLPALWLLIQNEQKFYQNRFLNLKLWDHRFAKSIWKFTGIAVAAVVMNKLAEWGIRTYAIAQYDMVHVGYWQAVSKLSDGYSNIFNAAFGLLFFAKASSLLHEQQALRKFTLQTTGSILIFSTIALGLLYVFRTNLLILLFSPAFVPAEAYLLPQCIADAFKFPAWLFGFILLSREKLWQYFWLQLGSHSIFLVLYALMEPLLHIEALLWANALRFIAYFFWIRAVALRY